MVERGIGVMVDSFRCDTVREGILKAKEVGAQGLQIYAVDGPMHPDAMSDGERRKLRQFISDNGLAIAALCGDLGGHGFAVSQDNPHKIEVSKKIMDLALDLGTRVVTTHIGVVPQAPEHPRYRVMQEACNELGEYGDEVGAKFAIETGPETAIILKEFLDSLGSSGVGVNYDPANLVMVTDDDPVAGVIILGDHIVHTHAKDGIMLKKTDPERIYNFFAEGGIEDLRMEEFFLEKPLGQGAVDFQGYIKALDQIGYGGFYTIEREVGENPEEDIKKAVVFLESLLRE
ncbi:MAG: xylose isomerase [Spirochaetales bacterium]|nr:xylose isomerase [Spirochaetales bacterium]